jgi:hypothetical protein
LAPLNKTLKCNNWSVWWCKIKISDKMDVF